jgi:tRNA1(Val) A37 N6-methylase TrmN6
MKWKVNQSIAHCTLLDTACFYLLSMVDLYFIFGHDVWLLSEHTFIFHCYNILDFCTCHGYQYFFFCRNWIRLNVAQVDLVQLEVNEVDLKYVHSEHK